MISLYISLYPEPNPKRRAELEKCLEINLSLFDKVYVFEEIGHEFPVEDPKIILIKSSTRPTFNFIFDIINLFSEQNDINIIANSDIFFTAEALGLIGTHLQRHQVFALTRYNMIRDNSEDEPEANYVATFFGRRDAQDSFVFKGKIQSPNAEFTPGIGGCDNSLVHLLHMVGYQVSNPSLSIKTFHLHNDEHRIWHNVAPVPPPYMLLDPISL